MGQSASLPLSSTYVPSLQLETYFFIFNSRDFHQIAMKYGLVLAFAVFALLATVEASDKKKHHKHGKISKHPDVEQRDIQDAIDVLMTDEADLNGECLTMSPSHLIPLCNVIPHNVFLQTHVPENTVGLVGSAT